MKTDLKIVYKGEFKYNLNSNLVQRQNLSEKDIDILKELHIAKLDIFSEMEKTNDSEKLKSFADQIEEIEFKLQKTWGFPENRNLHEWYNVPKCTCPKLDNRENRGTEFRIFDSSCPVHGKNI